MLVVGFCGFCVCGFSGAIYGAVYMYFVDAIEVTGKSDEMRSGC